MSGQEVIYEVKDFVADERENPLSRSCHTRAR